MSMEQIARDIREGTFPRKSEATLREEASPREYLKIKYSTNACKCGNCQLVPPEKLAAWADEIDRLRKAMEVSQKLIGAINNTAPPAVKASNINMAWHVLDDNLRASSVPSTSLGTGDQRS